MEKFSPNSMYEEPHKIDNVQGQEGLVNDQEKAFKMANIERESRKFVDLYEKFLVAAEQGEEAIEAFTFEREDAPYPILNTYELLYGLKRMGIPPKHIVEYGKFQAEYQGAMHDWNAELKNMSEDELFEAMQKLKEGRGRYDDETYPIKMTDFPSLINDKTEKLLTGEKMHAITERQREIEDYNRSCQAKVDRMLAFFSRTVGKG